MSGGALPATHLVHGMGTVLEEPAWPAITAAEAEATLARFPGAGDLVEVRWHSPRPFSAAALLQTTRGAFLLKRHHRLLRSPESLAQEHAFIAHLRAGGLSVPEIIAAADRTGTTAQGDWTYELHRQAPGIDLYRDRLSWTPFLSPGHAHAAGVALARLHLAARNFAEPARGVQPLVASFTILPAPDPLLALEAYITDRPALAAYLADKPWRSALRRLFGALGEGLAERLAEQPSLWTHNDWHPSNLLWTADGEVCTVIDFGLATRTCALHDIATAIERSAVEWLRLGQGADDTIADAGAALAILTGYRTVLPLSSADIDTIIRLLPLVHVEFALSEVDYFAGTLDDHDSAWLAWDGYLIGHADWFLTATGQAFLAELQSETAS
jgi:Ser/Thr protein kinase RdoA (MazF antagonist)